jgi:uncharacterized protein (DUF2141 family)
MVRTLFVVVALALLVLSATCSAATLDILVKGLTSDRSDVHIALYNKAENFPYHEGVLLEEKVSVTNGTARLQFANLTADDYAIAVYHDENANHEFDQGLFGIPLEDYGFSNNAPVFFGPPSFDEAKFPVSEPATTIEINLDP